MDKEMCFSNSPAACDNSELRIFKRLLLNLFQFAYFLFPVIELHFINFDSLTCFRNSHFRNVRFYTTNIQWYFDIAIAKRYEYEGDIQAG